MESKWSTLLEADDPLVLFIDPQPGLALAVESQSRLTLENNLVALAKTAAAFQLPVILTTSASFGFNGPTFAALLGALAPVTAIERSGMNAWEDPAVVCAVRAIGRKTIVIAGLLTESCIAFTALSALASDYDVRVVVDACGATSTVAQESAITLMMQAGMIPRTWLQLLLELQRDWSHNSSSEAANVVKEHAGAYGMGLQYAGSKKQC